MPTFAIIPAAGRSQRMAQPKLLLPWGRSTVIERVLGVWRASRVDRVVVVVHPQDARLAELGRAAGAEVVQPPAPPSEMKVSIRLALEHLRQYAPAATDAWLVAPADLPGLKTAVIDAIVAAYQTSLAHHAETPRVWAPRCGGRRGHPVLFPWSLAAEVARLADDEGLNALLSRHPVEYVDTLEETICEDLDTPEDYERLRPREGH